METLNPTTTIICPGIHPPSLTDRFLQALERRHVLPRQYLLFPSHRQPPLSSFHLLHFLCQQLVPKDSHSLLFLSFSAGVVGAIGAAWGWRLGGGEVRAFIALDGWGVPLGGDFPIHRLSHDGFTHWSSSLLGSGRENFYADPPVQHLDLWGSPESVVGWRVRTGPGGESGRSPTSCLEFLASLFRRYGAL